MDKKLLAKLVAGLFGTAPFLASVNQQVLAAGTDIATAPLANRRSSDIKPNIMLVFDDSNSMNLDYMPEELESYDAWGPGRRSYLCNTIYYNPNITNTVLPLSPYLVPRSDTGADLNAADPATFTNAYDNGYWSYDQFGQTAGVGDRRDLSSAPPGPANKDNQPSGVPAYYWSLVPASTAGVNLNADVCKLTTLGYDVFNTATAVCSSSNTAPYSGTYFLDNVASPSDTTCSTNSGGAQPYLIWKRVNVSATSGPTGYEDERQRFANWYSYYRTRMQMTKSSIGRAFLPLTTKKKFRTGFITISPQQIDNGAEQSTVYSYNSAAPYNSKFLEIRNFDNTDTATNQPARWFNILYAQRGNGQTPLREGLSRVGRYYAGKNDGPNAGMIPSNASDPVQYACQANYAILTTDGYWDSPPASIGGFKLDYSVAMDNQDGDITETDSNGQGLSIGARPIYDGTITSTATHTDRQNAYQNVACTYYLQSDLQILMNTSQNLQSTSQNLQTTTQALQNTSQFQKSTLQNNISTSQVLLSTNQKLQGTSQNLQSTSQDRQSTAQVRQTTLQQLKSTNQNLQSTLQVQQFTSQLLQVVFRQLKSTNQFTQGTRQERQTIAQVRQTTTQQLTSTNQFKQGTSQTRQSTSQVRQTTSQQLTSTNQFKQGTSQNLQSTSQVRQTTTQQLTSTSQQLQSTSQLTVSTHQELKSTSQVKSCNASGTCTPGTPMATCTATVENNTCSTFLTGPTSVATCTPTAASAGNSWTTTTCATAATGPTGTSSCTAIAASAGNGWVTTTCTTTTTGPTAVATCTAVTASAGNSWIGTTCATSATGPSAISATCTPTSASAGNSWITTTCTTSTTGPTGVSSCTATSASSGNSWIATTCSTSNAGPTGVSSCTATSASAGNSWIATTCATTTTANVAVSACTATAASAGNSWITTTCTTSTTGPSAISATCTPVSASAGNSWITTTCTTTTTGPTGVSACSAVAASSGNSWIATSCSTSTSGPTGVSACTGTAASAGNSWITTTCSTSTTSNVAASSCTATAASAGNSWIATTCTTSTTGPSAISASCTPTSASAGNSWITTTCTTSTTGPTGVSACSTVAASSGNSWIATSCSTSTSGPTGVSACTAVAASAGNSWSTTSCSTSTTTNVAVASCTATAASAGNSWVTTTCTTSTTGPTARAICRPVSASSGNSWITTTCTTTTLSSTPVSTCTPVAGSAGNSWTTTICPTATTGPTGVASCTPVAASAGNSWIATTCATSTTTNVPIATCTAAAGSAGNSWITTTCATSTTTNVAASTCTATSASAGNSWITTTCTTTTTGPTGVSSCTAVSASAGNSWTTTSCSTSTSGPTGIATCSPVSASAGNSWITTTCSTSTTTNVAIATCTATSASAGNSWVTTTCATSTTSNVAISACTATSASAGNSWVTTTCTTSTTGPGSIATCTPVSASAGNSWTTTTCQTTTTALAAIAACTPVSASAGNGWITTTCVTSTTTNVPSATCTTTSASAGNSWITTTCVTTTTSLVPIATCTATSASAGNSWITTTCSPTTVANTPVATCTPTSASAGNSWITTTCSTPVTTNVPVSACTPTSASAGNSWVTTTCGTSVTNNEPVASCTNTAPSAGNSWITTVCDTTSSTLNTTNVTVQTCTVTAANAGNSYVSTACAPQAGTKNQYQTQTRDRIDSYSGSIIVGTNPTGGGWPSWPSGDWVTTPASVPGGGWSDLSLCLASVPAAWTGWPAFTTRQPDSSDPQYPPSSHASGTCTSWPCTSVSTATSGGSSNSLADVAQYYYKTDLRPAGTTGFNGADVSANKVFAPGTDTTEGDMGKWQHMTTFTMGLGVSGTIAFNPLYKTKPLTSSPTDFEQIRCPNAASDPTLCVLWPEPVNINYATEKKKRVDDLWHAAVDGRGQYFSASDPDAVYAGLQTTLLAISAQSGAGTGATTSTQNPVAGNALTYRSSFRTVDWIGNVIAQEIYTGSVLALQGTTMAGEIWSAQSKLDAATGQACDNRNISLIRIGATNNLTPFTWSTKACDGAFNPTGTASTGLNSSEQNYFLSTSPAYTSPFPMASWSQFINMSSSQKTLAQGANLVNYLRGQKGTENFAQSDDSKLFRLRQSRLGDIVGSQPVYVPPPNAQFTDLGYSMFKQKTGISNRTPMIYVGGNDGMLHAFNATATGGNEAWAVVPSPMLPNMWRLADTEYSEGHIYFVDGTPAYGDVFDRYATVGSDACSTTTTAGVARDCWKTILVGGYGGGGRGYYALDITDPSTPKALWEFNWSDTCYDSSVPATHSSDCHIGLSFGQALITKLTDGSWVVLVPSGFNNINSPAKSGDGHGYLYVLDAITGKIIKKIDTGAGSAAAGASFGHINAYVENYVQDNTADRVYGGDALGNVWRITLTGATDNTDDVVRLATLKDSSGNPQPITTTPTLMNVGATQTRMLFVGTGRYLGETDLSDTQTQSVYGIVEDLTLTSSSADYIARGNSVYPASGLTLRQQLNQVTLSIASNTVETTVIDATNTTVTTVTTPVSGTATTTTTTYPTQLGATVGTTVREYSTRAASAPACSAAAAAGLSCSGWYVDLPETGERVNIDPRLVLGTLLVSTTVTNLAACDTGGNAWILALDAATGAEVPTSPYKAGRSARGALIVGVSFVRDSYGRILAKLTKSDGTEEVTEVPTQQGSPLGRRTGWRDLLGN